MSARRRIAALGLAALAALLVATTALGALNRKGSVTTSAPYKWDGGPVTGVTTISNVNDVTPCDVPGKDCDDTLLNTAPGQVTVHINSSDANAPDLDLYVYRSDDQGTEGKFVRSSTGATAEEKVTFKAVSGGYFLVRVIPATATAGTYQGDATELPLPPTPTGGDYGTDPNVPGGGSPGDGGSGGTGGGGTGGGAPGDDLAPAAKVRHPANGFRSLSGTASDPDGKVAYVDVALVRVAGTHCRALRPGGRLKPIKKCTAPPFVRARGTTAWTLPLTRRLPRGAYVIYARATDNQGRGEDGFGPANRVRVSIR
jgi:hypothetical protein